MPRKKSKESREGLKKMGYKPIRAYIKEKNKDKLKKYQKNNDLTNIDHAIDSLIENKLDHLGGFKK